MSPLLDLQRRFRIALLTGEETGLPEILGGPIAPAVRFGIYRNNVIGNLTGVLGLAYPAVKRLVGETFFVTVAEQFIITIPPANADLYEYGEGFDGFLAALESAWSLLYLPDIARLEWAVHRALHAPAMPSLIPEALLDLSPVAQAELRLVPHPSLSLLSLAYPARAIREAVLIPEEERRTASLGDIDLAAGGEDLAVLCDRDGLDVIPLSHAAFGFAQALIEGGTLGDALGLVAAADAAPLLAELLVRGIFVDYLVPETSVKSYEP